MIIVILCFNMQEKKFLWKGEIWKKFFDVKTEKHDFSVSYIHITKKTGLITSTYVQIYIKQNAEGLQNMSRVYLIVLVFGATPEHL